MERTLVLIKPDGFRRKLIGDIITRFEHRNLDIRHLKLIAPSLELAEKHYSMHQRRDFFDALVAFITSGPVVAMILEGDNCIEIVRNMVGAVDPREAAVGTIRGDFTIDIRENLVHASDSPDSAKYEIGLWFGEQA